MESRRSISSGVYPETVGSFVFDTGTIGKSHYLAVPYNAPEKGAALLVMDFLQSPEAQIDKMKAEVWGDIPAFDVSKVNDDILKYIEWIKEIWTENSAK